MRQKSYNLVAIQLNKADAQCACAEQHALANVMFHEKTQTGYYVFNVSEVSADDYMIQFINNVIIM